MLFWEAWSTHTSFPEKVKRHKVHHGVLDVVDLLFKWKLWRELSQLLQHIRMTCSEPDLLSAQAENSILLGPWSVVWTFYCAGRWPRTVLHLSLRGRKWLECGRRHNIMKRLDNMNGFLRKLFKLMECSRGKTELTVLHKKVPLLPTFEIYMM